MLSQVRIDMPAWVARLGERLPERLETAESRMAVAVALARQNIVEESGGPFGALVVARDTGQVIALAVNRVEPACCSAAHAEVMALSLAQQQFGVWNLAETGLGPMELVTSCEPCAMCLGAIPWSGVVSVVCGATREDAEAAGFDEGDRSEAWIDQLEQRGISVTRGVLRQQAAEVLDRYRRIGRTLYNPG
ncbi:MAG: nucleoside deaminase [Wenzhouxiangella sp.]|jgi:tRNA(Arg) A34 adenosine deaminase TadA|nr:nucleoside deaminase [Wenzhouxiangella sp.]